jgi:hypothetical protein
MTTIVSTRIVALQAIGDANRLQADSAVLLIDQKASWIALNAAILAEQSGIDAQADAFAVSRVAYDASITALTAYLATLTTPVAWNVLTDRTTIVLATFKDAFNLVALDKQALLNSIYAAAQALAVAASASAALKLAKAGGDTLTGVQDIDTTSYAAGIRVGTGLTWNTSTGAVTGGSGVVTTKRGIVGVNAGTVNFVLSAADGSITALLGTIGGWTIGSTSLSASAGYVGFDSTVTGGNDLRIWAGSATPASAPFRVYEDGSIYAGSGTFAGDINTSGKVIGTGGYNAGGGTSSISGIPVSTNVNGVTGVASGTGVGVSGLGSGLGSGVLATNTGVGAGILGINSGSGYGAYFQGNTVSSAVYIYGNTGQYALELGGTGTASMPGVVTGGMFNGPIGGAGATPAAISGTTGTFTGAVKTSESGGAGWGGSAHASGFRTAWSSGYGASFEAWDGDAPKWGIYNWNANTPSVVMQGQYNNTDVTFTSAVTMPAQPAFLAYNSANITTSTGSTGPYKLICNAEVFDQAGSHNTSTGEFVAGVTGRYRFSFTIHAYNMSGATFADVWLYTDNRNVHLDETITVADEQIFNGSTLVDMDANDVAYINFKVLGLANNTTLVIVGNVTGNPETSWSGELVC